MILDLRLLLHLLRGTPSPATSESREDHVSSSKTILISSNRETTSDPRVESRIQEVGPTTIEPMHEEMGKRLMKDTSNMRRLPRVIWVMKTQVSLEKKSSSSVRNLRGLLRAWAMKARVLLWEESLMPMRCWSNMRQLFMRRQRSQAMKA
ncbi:hypothetical protein AMTR_s00037p00095320 [Amborella trichopoda]|uniref:Uncharacterized protein n=1 Tax=Amborella trichopoda TaxID=13333 RepID=U5D7C6_AMBTC|nr:hypothetical protein AMTR_s00037p00095320 [Amborella trichopoda]